MFTLLAWLVVVVAGVILVKSLGATGKFFSGG